MPETVEVNTKGLDALLKALTNRPPTAKVGILGDKNARHVVTPKKDKFGLVTSYKYKTVPINLYGKSGKLLRSKIIDDAATNAAIGMGHEFGDPTRHLPQRSFLRVPISERWAKELETAGLFEEDVIKAVIKKKSILPWMKLATIVAEKIVITGFTNGGYGKWAPWAQGYSSTTGNILVETQQLRDSITSEVKE